VQVPALNLYLLAVAMPGGGRTWVPLSADARFPQLKAGVPVDLPTALAALVPAARELDPAQSS
jgi:hypothetical protein